MLMDQIEIEKIRNEGLTSVVIAICTYKRPVMLDACLHSISALDIPEGIFLQVVVIDNDNPTNWEWEICPHKVFKQWANGFPHMAHFIRTSQRGIAYARNAARLFSIHHNADYLCFIDDDEVAQSGWLKNLMHPDYKNVPILAGWNVTDYTNTPNWARPKIGRPREEGAIIGQAMGGNVRIHRDVFHPLMFDTRIGLGGGEDGDFFARAANMGFEQRFTKRAITFEVAHPERYTMSGQIKRAYWNGASSMREFMIRKGRIKAILSKVPDMILAPFKGLLYLLSGIFYFPVNQTVGLQLILKGNRALAKLVGRIATIFGHIPQAYKVTYGE